MPPSPPTPRDFTAFEPLLWHVVGALARVGLVAPPDEARDVLHDFFLDDWPSVQRNHDPSRSRFETYLFAAFYRYARRRILEAQTWRRRFVDLDAATELPSQAPGPEDNAAWMERLRRLHDALAQLPPRERSLVIAFVGEDGSSERQLAKQHGLTRHAVRTLLARALTTLAALMHEAPRSEAAGSSGRRLPPQSAAYTALEVAEKRKSETSRTGEESTMNALIETLAAALRSPGDQKRLDAVRESADRIREALEEDDAVLLREVFVERKQDPAWIGEVYAALAPAQAGVGDSLAQALRQVRDDRNAELREAYRILLSQLHPTWVEEAFEGVEPLPLSIQRRLAQESGIDEADSMAAAVLLRFGVTPFAIAGAARGITLLLDRVSLHLRNPELAGRLDASVRIGPGVSFEAPDDIALRLPETTRVAVFPRRLLQVQVAGAAHVVPEVANALANWLLQVMQDFPYLVEGYVLDAAGDVFDATFETFHGVAERWLTTRNDAVFVEVDDDLTTWAGVIDAVENDPAVEEKSDPEHHRGMGMV